MVAVALLLAGYGCGAGTAGPKGQARRCGVLLRVPPNPNRVPPIPRHVDDAANKRDAQFVAQCVLARVEVPSGANRVAANPVAGNAFRAVSPGVQTRFQVDLRRYWRAPGSPQTVIRWIKAHPPAGAISPPPKHGSGGIFNYPGPGRKTVWSDVAFGFAAARGKLNLVGLQVTVAPARGGGTAVRADAFAVWVISRPAWERVPQGIHAVRVVLRQLTTVRHHRPVFRTFVLATSDPRAISRMRAWANGLPVAQPWSVPISCPPPTSSFAVQFLGSKGTPLLARLSGAPCEDDQFWLQGRTGLPLTGALPIDLLWATGVLPACAHSELSASAGPPLRYPAIPSLHRPPIAELEVTFRNTSSAVCGLRGFAHVSLRDTHDRPLPTQLTYSNLRPYVVDLVPGDIAVTRIDWPINSCTGPTVGYLNVTLPRVSGTFTVQVRSSRQSMAPCAGRIRVDVIA